jgi:hypothetical protein
VRFLVIEPVEITDYPGGDGVGDLLAKCRGTEQTLFFRVSNKEVSTSTDGIDGDFSTTNAACSVPLLCSRCTGLIFFRMCEPSVRLFLMVSV